MGVASLVLGIVSIISVLFLSGFQWIGAITGVIGIILASKGRKDPQTRGIATAGMVCSIIGLVLCFILFVACAACVGGLTSMAAAMQ